MLHDAYGARQINTFRDFAKVNALAIFHGAKVLTTP
jgi:hypothetical protein